MEFLLPVYLKQCQIVNITPFLFEEKQWKETEMSRLCWFPITCARYCDQAVCNHRQHTGRTVWSRAEHASNPLMVRCVTCGTQLHRYAARPSPPPCLHNLCRGVPSLHAGSRMETRHAALLTSGASRLSHKTRELLHLHRRPAATNYAEAFLLSALASIITSPAAPPSGKNFKIQTEVSYDTK